MEEKTFIKVVVGGATAAILAVCVAGYAVHRTKQNKLQSRIDAVTQTLDTAIKRSQQQCDSNQWDEAIRTVDDAQKQLVSSGLALAIYDHRLQQCRDKIKSAKTEYNRRLAQGWAMFEGRFISPQEKSQIISERQRERERKENAERVEREEAARLLAEQKERERRAVEQKAREMYGPYKKSAESVADNLLKLISATQTGINITKHREMLQELQFTFNKFELERTPIEKTYISFTHLSTSVEHFKSAQHWWNERIDSIRKGLHTFAIQEEKNQQEAWAKAAEEYAAAMRALSDGK